MDLGIAGETALVLGGTQGLGFACAASLAGEGVTVVISGRDEKKGEAAAASIGNSTRYVPGDLSSPEGRAQVYEAAVAAAGDPSILVTNAGGPPPGGFAEKDHAAWLAALELNMLSAIDMTQRCLPAMLARGFGRIVNITSLAVREPYPNLVLANGARAGLHGAMGTLAREIANTGVTVNNLLPGLMDTPALQRVYRAQAEHEGIAEAAAKARMADGVPAKRLGTAEDFGPACAFLCSRLAGYITAQNLTVDGGLVKALL
jgi:3-oxoacyl-[acyl-carrier protein] reductase